MKELFTKRLVGTTELREACLSELLATLLMVPQSPKPNYSAIRNLELELGLREMEEIECPSINIPGATFRYEPGQPLVIETEKGQVRIEAPVAAQIYRGSPPSMAAADAILKEMYGSPISESDKTMYNEN